MLFSYALSRFDILPTALPPVLTLLHSEWPKPNRVNHNVNLKPPLRNVVGFPTASPDIVAMESLHRIMEGCITLVHSF